MNYQEYLQRFQYPDSPWAQQEYRREFGGANNLGFDFASGDRIGGPSSPGMIWGAPSGHASAAGQGGMTADYRTPIEREAFRNEEFTHNPLTGELAGDPWQVSDTGSYTPSYEETLLRPESPYLSPSDSLAVAPNLPPPAASTSLLSAGPSGYASVDAYADTGVDYAGQGISEELAAQTAAEAGAESGWGGPWTFAANQALNLIPTRDRKKVDTPFGDEGSKSGMMKGAGKGALLGGTIGSAFPVIGTGIGAAVGGGVGLIAGSQGYFDSTSAPTITMSSIRRGGGGMQGGLLGGGSMYG